MTEEKEAVEEMEGDDVLSTIFSPPAEEIKEQPVAAKEVEKAVEEIKAPVVIPDAIDWEKRFKDTQKFVQESREENKLLKTRLSTQDVELKTLRGAVEETYKSLYGEDKELPIAEKEIVPEEDVAKSAWAEKVVTSESVVRPVYEDYDSVVGSSADEKSAPFKQAVDANPALWGRVRSAANPALEAYRIGKEFVFQAQYGKTPEEIRASVEKEVREKLDKEQKEKLKPPPAKQIPSLKDVKGQASPSDIEHSLSLDKIFAKR